MFYDFEIFLKMIPIEGLMFTIVLIILLCIYSSNITRITKVSMFFLFSLTSEGLQDMEREAREQGDFLMDS